LRDSRGFQYCRKVSSVFRIFGAQFLQRFCVDTFLAYSVGRNSVFRRSFMIFYIFDFDTCLSLPYFYACTMLFTSRNCACLILYALQSNGTKNFPYRIDLYLLKNGLRRCLPKFTGRFLLRQLRQQVLTVSFSFLRKLRLILTLHFRKRPQCQVHFFMIRCHLNH